MTTFLVDLSPRELQRFERSIDRSGSCHVWIGSDRHEFGYGYFALYRSGKRRTHRYLSHRLAYALATGEWPAGRVVRHTCDNPPCVNPDHLIVGTQAENVEDAKIRGRMDLSGLSADTDHECRRCGVDFVGIPARRYCSDCQVLSRRARRAA